jgi:hypothetical protein
LSTNRSASQLRQFPVVRRHIKGAPFGVGLRACHKPPTGRNTLHE